MADNNLLKLLNQLKTGEVNRSIDIEKKTNQNDIAIIGVAVKLPYAQDLDGLYDVLQYKRDCISYPGEERLSDITDYLNFKGVDSSTYEVTEAAFLSEIDKFDYTFFKISSKEASLMDPCQRIFTETAWHAFEDAGYTKQKLKGTKTGVFVGRPHTTEYYKRIKAIEPHSAILAGPGNIDSIIPSRIAYMLDLTGPSLLIDTACSSSLLAVHLACQSIRSRECEMALVGGINLIIEPIRYHDEDVPDIASSTGRARTFSDDSDGTGQGEGCIAILLKPLDKAIKDKDNIHGIIRGSASNNDGASIGITAPSMKAQEDVLISAWQNANISPDTIGYIEAHGTGTKLGDPIEIDAITNAFGRYTKNKQFCGIGSIKTNYGHLDSAAGLLGLVKAVLALKSQTLLPTIHFTSPNKKIDFISSPLYVVDEAQKWDSENSHPRRCGVSSFGLSGTNCHVIVEEAHGLQTNDRDDATAQGARILTISAKSETALKAHIQNYIRFIDRKPQTDIADLCYTTQIGRDHYHYRIAVIADNISDLSAKLLYLKNNGLSAKTESGIYYGYCKAINESGTDSSQADFSADAFEVDLSDLASKYVQGFNINWNSLYNNQKRTKISIPLYPFDKKRCWIDVPKLRPIQQQAPAIPQNNNKEISEETMGQEQLIQDKAQNSILRSLQEFVAGLFGMELSDVNGDISYFELGIDSISIIQLKQEVKNKYNIDISADRLYGDVNNLSKLADYIADKLPPTEQSRDMDTKEQPRSTAVPMVDHQPPISQEKMAWHQDGESGGNSEIERIINKQLEIMSHQLALLRGLKENPALPAPAVKEAGQTAAISQETKNDKKPRVNGQDALLQRFMVKSNPSLSEKQKQYLNKLIESYEKKTAASKKSAQDTRRTWANARSTQGFSQAWKELIYPILAKASEGARIWDLDGNEYIDFAMGFGVNLFGYNHPAIKKAIQEQLEKNVVLGALSDLPGEVAQLVSELTGVERVSFANSGTEAIMNLLRIARAATGKNKIALFAGSFHGTFDGVFVVRDASAPSEHPIPLSLGTPTGMVEDVIILDYGDEKSLELIEEYKDELAAVLVEPVQSRNPDLQPRGFLHSLRKLTNDLGIALIFDEVITGFRIHPGGAQAYFNIEADLVAYGKVAGGSMPIGIMGGKSKFMDRIDGGMWQFKDSSAPSGFLVHTGGTFCQHPLTMAAAKAALQTIKAEGSALQEGLNKKTEQLASFLNTFFTEAAIPLKVAYFGSLFIFKTEKEPLLLRFLYYKLIEKGFYLWEGATCFISTAHSDEDIAAFAKGVQDCCRELVQNECFSFNVSSEPLKIQQIKEQLFDKAKKKIPITESQLRLWALTQKDKKQSAAFNEKSVVVIKGKVKQNHVKQAVKKIMARHEILRTAAIDKEYLYILPDMDLDVPLFSYLDDTNTPKDWSRQIIKEEIQHTFDLEKGPLIRITLIQEAEEKYILCVVAHHLIMDGWSMNVFMREFAEHYMNITAAVPITVPEPVQFSWYAEKLADYYRSEESKAANKYWVKAFSKTFTPMDLATNPFYRETSDSKAGKQSLNFSPSFTAQLKSLSQSCGASLFMTLLGAYGVLLFKLTNQTDIVIGIPFSGQLKLEAEHLIGHCISMVPFYGEVDTRLTYRDFLKKIKEQVLTTNRNQIFSYTEIIKELDALGVPYQIPNLNITFNMDRAISESGTSIFEFDSDAYSFEEQQNKYDLFLDIVEVAQKLHMTFAYNKNMIPDDIMAKWMAYYESILSDMVNHPDKVMENMILE